MNDIGFHETERGESEESIPSVTREESYSELKIRLENCEKRYEDLKMKNERLHNENVDLTTRLDLCGDEIRRLQRELESARVKITQLQNERDLWKQRCEECRGIAEELRKQITKLKKGKAMCEEEKQQLQDKIRRHENEIGALITDNKNLQNALESQMQKGRYRTQELEEKIEELKLSLDEKNRSLIECKQRLDKWEEEKRQMERTIENLQEKIRIYRDFVEELKRLLDRIPRQIEVIGPERPVQPQRYEETSFPQPEILSEPKPSESEEKEFSWESDRDEEGFMAL